MRAGFQDIVVELEAMAIILETTGDEMNRYLLDILLEECRELVWRLGDDNEDAL